MKKSKILFFIIVLLILGIIGFILVKPKNENKLENRHVSYDIYVKINPLVKLTYDVESECVKNNCKIVNSSVTNVDLVNGDAKRIYSTIDYVGKTVESVIAFLIDIAEQNNIDVSNVLITSSYEFNKDELIKKILELSSSNVEINYNYQSVIDEKQFETTTTQATTTKKTCTSKKFKKKFTYVYKTKEECKKSGNNDFNNITDTIDDTIFSYGCEAIKDDCGDTWYGVVFYKWSEEKGEYPYYY